MSILWELYNYYLGVAKTIPGFVEGSKEDVPYDITELANNYCKARDENDEIKKSQYMSALMIRYWYMIPYLYEKSKTLRVNLEDMSAWLYEGIEKACLYRGWLDSTMPVSKEERGAEKCINQCITSIREYYFKHYNQLKRKGEREAYSLEELLEDYQDSSCSSYLSYEENHVEGMDCSGLVQSFIDKGDIFPAVVLDLICFWDVTTEVKVKKQYTDDEGNVKTINVSSSQFSQAKLAHSIKEIDDDYIAYFVDTYNVDADALVKVITKVKGYSRMYLSTNIKKALEKFRKSKEVRSLYGLC